MKISFKGAARTVTGSKHLVTLDNGTNILIDCGMFQGMGTETAGLNQQFGFEPAAVAVTLLSHAHIDHSGLLPKLVKEGFSGKIYCTPATRELSEILLLDSADIQSYESSLLKRNQAAGGETTAPLYDAADVTHCMQLFETIPFDQWTKVHPDVEVLFLPNGHLIGSAAILLKVKERRKTTTLLFSGDIGRYRSTLLQPPATMPQADYIIMESTYGDKYHDITFNTIETLQKWINKVCVQRGGKLIIPAFSVGRTQEVLYALNQLSLEKKLPDIPVFIDSPLSHKATATIKHFMDEFNERLQQVLRIDDDPFDFPGLRYIQQVDDSQKLTEFKDPCIIISASGTADTGRVRHHIASIIADERSAVLMVGYCGAKSLGGQLLAGMKEVEIFNDACSVVAEIGQVQGMSAHGDVDDLLSFLSSQSQEKVKGIFLVHGEYDVQRAFTQKLTGKGFQRIECPAGHQEYELPLKPLRKRKRIPLEKNLTQINVGT